MKSENDDKKVFIIENIKKIINELKNEKKIHIIGGSSDGEFCFWEEYKLINNYYHVCDPSHMLKCLRNQLMNKDLILNNGKFSMENFLFEMKENQNLNNILSDDCVLVNDIMNEQLCLDLTDKEVINELKKSNNLTSRDLAEYLENIRLFFDSCRNDMEINKVVENLLKVRKFFLNWKKKKIPKILLIFINLIFYLNH